jgi:hypothetical protein
MEGVSELSGFFEAVSEDYRIGATHISLYMALFLRWNRNGFTGPVIFTSGEIMRMAKICSRATYHKCLRDLVEYGYIQYEPSCNPLTGNKAFLKIYYGEG